MGPMGAPFDSSASGAASDGLRFSLGAMGPLAFCTQPVTLSAARVPPLKRKFRPRKRVQQGQAEVKRLETPEKVFTGVVKSKNIQHMIRRILEERLAQSPKSVLLLGPRQVGKSTLSRLLEPDLEIQLADEESYQQHLKDPGLLKRIVAARPGPQIILLDEVQRVPSLLPFKLIKK